MLGKMWIRSSIKLACIGIEDDIHARKRKPKQRLQLFNTLHGSGQWLYCTRASLIGVNQCGVHFFCLAPFATSFSATAIPSQILGKADGAKLMSGHRACAHTGRDASVDV